MFNPYANADKKVVISLMKLGINTHILTTVREIEETKKELEETPDHHWCNGLGKDYLYKILLRKLKVKDVYFNENPAKIKPRNPKWIDFCNDCLLLYVLDTMLSDGVFKLVHPAQYREMIKATKHDATTGGLPDYIENIPTVIQ
jgi:hypothetical protein